MFTDEDVLHFVKHIQQEPDVSTVDVIPILGEWPSETPLQSPVMPLYCHARPPTTRDPKGYVEQQAS